MLPNHTRTYSVDSTGPGKFPFSLSAFICRFEQLGRRILVVRGFEVLLDAKIPRAFLPQP